jgi:hypothetical protein
MDGYDLPDFYSLFEEVILDRANLIVEEGEIEWLLLGNSEIKAHVYGSKRYTVYIKWDEKGEYEFMQCSCPYEWSNYCKHLAAVLIKLDEGDVFPEQIPEEIPQDEGPFMHEILKKARKSELVSFINMLIKNDPQLEYKIRAFVNYNKEMKKPDYKVLVKKFLERNSDDEWGYLHWHATDEVYDFIDNLVNKLLKKEKYDEVAELCPQVIAQLNVQMMYVDDSNGSLSGAVMIATEALLELSEDNLLYPFDKKKLIAELMNILQDDSIYDWDSGHNIWAILSRLIDDVDEMNQFFRVMEAKVDKTEERSKEYQRQCMVSAKITLYEKLGYEDEIEQIIANNLDLKTVRKKLVRNAIACKEYGEARKLISEGIEIAKSKGHPGTVSDWEEILLEIAINEGDKNTILDQAFHNFYNHHFSMDLFALIKEYIAPDQWDGERNNIIESVKSGNNYSVMSDLITIYHYEKMWPELMEAINAYGTDFYILDEYCDDLVEYDKDAVVQLYIQRIRDFLVTHKARKYYKVAARYIKKIKYMGAVSQSRHLAEELRNAYPQRKAMFEEFKGL